MSVDRQSQHLTRRERQLMNIIYELGEASVSDILERMDDPPSNAAVRFILRTLAEKGHVVFRRDGRRYVYKPSVPRARVQRNALRQMIRTFFDGSTERAVAAMLAMDASRLTNDELDRMATLIDEMKQDE